MQKIYLKKYDKSKVYAAPSGAIMNFSSVEKDFPAVRSFTFVVQTDAYDETMWGMFSLSSLRTKYGVNTANEDDAIAEIESAMNDEISQQEAASKEPTAEERIAAMLEYQALQNM